MTTLIETAELMWHPRMEFFRLKLETLCEHVRPNFISTYDLQTLLRLNMLNGAEQLVFDYLQQHMALKVSEWHLQKHSLANVLL
jgi:hypothetical protein